MASNPYINYYVNQAGGGINGFQGVRFQKGKGFFGDLFRDSIMPILRYLGKKAMDTGSGIFNDAVKGENILLSTKNRLKRTARDIAGDIGERATRYAQTGTGRRRKRRRVKQQVVSKKKSAKKGVAKKKKFKRRRKQKLLFS
jgi:hypothetical protein